MKDKPNIKIRFPSLLLIPFLAFAGCILKWCNETQADWLFVLLVAPVSIYFLWCIGYVVIAILSVVLVKMLKND